MNRFQEVIKAYLDGMAGQDEAFAEKYNGRMAQDKNCINQCCSYIIQQVRKAKRGAFADEEIYGMAAHFFDEGMTVEGITPKCTVVVPGEASQPDRKPSRPAQKKPKAQDEAQLSLF